RRRLAAHVATVEPTVTAFVGLRPAVFADPALPAVPSFTVKDTIDVAGYPTGLGIRSGYRREPDRSAGLVERLTGLGWVCLGKVTTTECALGSVKPSRNPRHPHVSTAGSSTGSAVSVAAGFCDVSVGSDSGGSLRWPAVYCGVTALRLTPRPELLTGVHCVAPSMESVGFVTRTVADLDWLWRRYDLATVTGAAAGPVPERLRFAVSVPPDEAAHPEVAALLDRVRAALGA
ncbi:amidase family protein, partial [Micromonospora zhanjiangensis]